MAYQGFRLLELGSAFVAVCALTKTGKRPLGISQGIVVKFARGAGHLGL
jgi:hypothetical protein